MTSLSEPRTGRYLDGTAGLALLGLAYVVAGVGLYYGLVVDSTTLVLPALAAVLVLVVASLYVLYRREGLVTAENGVIGACVAVSMSLLFALSGYTDVPSEVIVGAVLVVGVVVPSLLLEFTDYGRDD